MHKIIMGLTLVNLLVLGANQVIYLRSVDSNRLQAPMSVEKTPSLYDIRLQCQRLSAEAMGKTYKNNKGETVVFGYQSCVDQLIDAVKSENRTTLL